MATENKTDYIPIARNALKDIQDLIQNTTSNQHTQDTKEQLSLVKKDIETAIKEKNNTEIATLLSSAMSLMEKLELNMIQSQADSESNTISEALHGDIEAVKTHEE
jgi:hypothetical protein